MHARSIPGEVSAVWKLGPAKDNFDIIRTVWTLRTCPGGLEADKRFITETRLLKYTENFNTKNKTFQIKILLFHICLLKT